MYFSVSFPWWSVHFIFFVLHYSPTLESCLHCSSMPSCIALASSSHAPCNARVFSSSSVRTSKFDVLFTSPHFLPWKRWRARCNCDWLRLSLFLSEWISYVLFRLMTSLRFLCLTRRTAIPATNRLHSFSVAPTRSFPLI